MILSVLSSLVFVISSLLATRVESRIIENSSSIITKAITVNPNGGGGGNRLCVFCNLCERGAIIVTCKPKEQCFSYSFISELSIIY